MIDKNKLPGIIGLILLIILPITTLWLYYNGRWIIASFLIFPSIVLILSTIKPELVINEINSFQLWLMEIKMKRMLNKMTKNIKK